MANGRVLREELPEQIPVAERSEKSALHYSDLLCAGPSWVYTIEALLCDASPLLSKLNLAKTALDPMSDHMPILHNPVLQALIIALIFVLLGLTARAITLILRAYWDHFVQVLYFDSKY